MSQRRKGQESGFALLFVLLAAAMVAIFLYSQMPNVAFEGQRLKEADLISHGEEYKRAIKLFFRKFGRYPPSIDALENTNNMRFLRHRFKDPMTGKDDWRFIHAGGPGMFTDSLTKKPPAIAGTTSASDMAAASSGSASSGDASSTDPSQQAAQRWQLRRPQTTDAASGNPDAPADDSQQAGQGGPVALPGQPVYIPGGAGALQPGDPGYAPGQLQPGQPGYQPTQPGGRAYQPGGQAYGTPAQPLYPPVGLPGMPSGGFGGTQPGGTQAAGNGQSGGSSASSSSSSSGGGFGMMPAGGAGIAGVASKYQASGIKIYKDHAKYNEWEFIYDPRDEIIALGGALPAQPPTDQTGLSGSPGYSQSGAPPGGQPGTQPVTQPGTSNPN